MLKPTIIHELSDRAKQLFWEKVNKDGPLPDQTNPHYIGLGNCWQWTSAKTPGGYGKIFTDGKTVAVHRLSYTLEIGPIPPGKLVLHKCDNRACVNPYHLFLGTHAQNLDDCKIKGRHVAPVGKFHGSRTHPERVPRGCTSGPRLHPERMAHGDNNGSRKYPERLIRGEAHALAKLDAAKVREIRKQIASGAFQYQVAAAFGVSQPCIGSIVAGKTWKHVTQEI